MCTQGPPCCLRPPRHLGPAHLKCPCTAGASLYSWIVPVQLKCPNVRVYELCARHSLLGGDGGTIPISSDRSIPPIISGTLAPPAYVQSNASIKFGLGW